MCVSGMIESDSLLGVDWKSVPVERREREPCDYPSEGIMRPMSVVQVDCLVRLQRTRTEDGVRRNFESGGKEVYRYFCNSLFEKRVLYYVAQNEEKSTPPFDYTN